MARDKIKPPSQTKAALMQLVQGYLFGVFKTAPDAVEYLLDQFTAADLDVMLADLQKKKDSK